MRDNNQQTVKIELLSQWKLEAEFRKKNGIRDACITADIFNGLSSGPVVD